MKRLFKGRWDWRLMVPLGIVLVVVYLTLVPILMLIYGSFRDGPPGTESAFDLGNYQTVFTNPDLYESLANSLRFALGGSSLAFAVGCLLAWLTERTNIPFKGLIYASVFTELMIPGVLETIALVLLYSPKIGLINVFLMGALSLGGPPFNIYSMGGMIWAFGVGSFAVPFLLMAAAFRSMDPSLEEAAMVSGSGTMGTLYRITLKLALPAMLAAWLLLFIRAIETFEEPLVLGLPSGITVLATEVYLAVRRMPTDYNLAATFAIVYLVVAVVGLVIYFRATRFSERYAVITG
ncbi:MAG: ABC transporter permease, partial [Candidatus Binatia bacterium]